MNRGLKSTIAILCGALLGAALVAASGILAMHGSFLAVGGRLDTFATTLTEATDAQKPVASVLILAAVGAVAALIPTWISLRRTRATAHSFTWSFAVVTAGLGAWGLSSLANPVTQFVTGPAGESGSDFTFTDWIGAGSLEAIVWAVAVAALGALFYTRDPAPAPPSRATHDDQPRMRTGQ